MAHICHMHQCFGQIFYISLDHFLFMGSLKKIVDHVVNTLAYEGSMTTAS